MKIKELIEYGNKQLGAFPEDTSHGVFVRDVLDILKAEENRIIPEIHKITTL